ncbi:TldD/PmbA family protein [Candidatus Micrarchaeota archaeon]|nr:TldD/PmbA family protein [Candidatus Micrarchaeota archaeon]
MKSIHKLLDPYRYADARITRSRYSRAVLKDKEFDSVRQGTTESVACRVLVNGAMGFASSNRVNELPLLLKEAEKLARVQPGKMMLAEPEVHQARSIGPGKKSPENIDIEEKLSRLKAYEKRARKKKIHRVQVNYADGTYDSELYGSTGAHVIDHEHRVLTQIFVYAKENGRTEHSFDQVKARGGMEALKGMHEKIDRAVNEALLMLKAEHGPKGKMNVILDPEIAGVLAHEAVGHACEADEIQSGGSCLQGKLGNRIGSETVNISDSPVYDDALWGSYAYDDEGTKTKKTELVKKGVLNNYLTSLSTAKQNLGRLSGNARGESDSRPIVRMSNTYFEKGSEKKEALFSELKNGVYLVGCKEGQVSPKTGNFTFAARYGYVVKNGKQTKRMKNCSINGNILEALHHIKQVANDMAFTPGTCGKYAQEAPVTTGSPHLIINDILVG